MGRLLVVVLFALCAAGCTQTIPWSGDDDDDNNDNDDDSTPVAFYRIPFTIPAGSVDAPLADFPLPINFTDPVLRSTEAGGHVEQSDGSDIYFTDEDGDVLAHDREEYDSSQGELEGWVLIPNLDPNISTTIYLTYGNTDSAPSYSPEDVWGTEFVAVWHLDTFRDATTADHDGTPNGAQSTDGEIGNAADFNGAENISVAANADFDLSTNDPYTITAWIDPSGQPIADQPIVAKGDFGSVGWVLARTPLNEVALYVSSGADMVIARTTSTFGANFDHLAVVWDPNNQAEPVQVYLNGQPQPVLLTGTVDDLGDIDNNENLTIGSDAGINLGFNGSIDELRLSTEARNSDWIDTCDDSMSGGFLDVGPEESL